MEAAEHDDDTIFGALRASGARVLLIGRQALVLLGLPVATFDFDVWVHFDDIEKLNAAMLAIDHHPNRSPDEARTVGRYVLENSQHIDVMVARTRSEADGVTLSFDDAWSRRRRIWFDEQLFVEIPSVDDLIRTKRWAMREKDVADIQLLLALKRTENAGEGQP